MLNPIRRKLIDRMVLRPSRHPIDHGMQQRRMLTCRGKQLECFVQQHAGEGQRILVIKFPGTSGRAEQSTGLPLALMEGIGGTTWTWNPPGYGGSHGPASLPTIASAAIDFARQVIETELDDQTTLWLAGNSLGCATAMNVAAAIKLDPGRTGIVLRNPPPLTDVIKNIAHRYPFGKLMNRLAESVHEPMNVISTAGNVRLPAVFLKSGADTLVPPQLQDRVIQSYAGSRRVVLMDNLDHDGLATDVHEELIRDSLRWLLTQTS